MMSIDELLDYLSRSQTAEEVPDSLEESIAFVAEEILHQMLTTSGEGKQSGKDLCDKLRDFAAAILREAKREG